ncbi:aldehyde dehydrogenase family protein [Pseudarthrobacter sp. SSS035]|uniref:aldehyde dehydrogenase family protein n=1 Tax=Pseudarthrobacter sp. SSS035 TaxID=2931399 RepID=UPI00200D500E|nr:aldehyde dehydrogenase family protein [Pseudarthrobacter sp. SSS035]
MIVRDKFFIDGSWTSPSTATTIDVIDPATEQVTGVVPAGSAQDIDGAVQAANRAYPGWAATDAGVRADFLGAIADGIEARKDEIAALITSEVGTPITFSENVHVGSTITYFRDSEKALRDFNFEEQYNASTLIRKEPVGVVGAITPWNYPLVQVAAKLAPALATGCTVVLKPSEVAPLCIFVLAEIIQEVGLPAGVFNLVTGYGPEAGEPMATHPLVNLLSFTGSTGAGTRVAALGAADVKRVTLELGGKSASVVLPDADLSAAVAATVADCYSNSGQTCCAHTRLVVPRDRLSEVESLAVAAAESFTVGSPTDRSTQIGPVVSEIQLERVRAHISKAIDDGAVLLTGGAGRPDGTEHGYFVRPTVFSGITTSMPIAQEEVFGPVLVILAYDSVQEAIDIANDSSYGLGGAVWSTNHDSAVDVARSIRTGQVSINGSKATPDVPFGGFKKSGIGREGGVYAFEEFLEIKAIY